MILFINVLLTNKRFSRFDRGLLRTDDPLSVFRFMLASLEDIRFSHVYVFAELDPDDYPSEMADILRRDVARVFGSSDAVEFRDRRLLHLGEWKEFLSRELLPRNELIFYSGNHDHIFLDYNTEVLDACLGRLTELGRENGKAGLAYSHWPEWFSYRARLAAWDRNYFMHTSHYRDAIQVLTPGLLEHWFFADAAQLPDTSLVRRTEDLGWAGSLHYPQLVPHRELFRHYDAGSHFGVRISRCPPLEVPQGLLDDNLKLAYFRNADQASLIEARKQGYTCVGPCFENNRAVSDGAPDYAWVREDIPGFLLRRAKHFLVVGDGDADVEIANRDRHRCHLLADMFPLTSATLALLAPPAVRGDYGASAMAPEHGMSCDHRRNEALFVLKSPVRRKAGCVVYLDSERRFTLGQGPAQTLFHGIDGTTYHRCYTLISERKGTAWQPSGSAYHLAGDLHETLDGLAVYTFDFFADKIAALRKTVDGLDFERLVIVEPQCPAALGLLVPIINERVAQELGPASCLGIRVTQGKRSAHLALALGREVFDHLLTENPRLMCNETFSVCDIIAAHCRRKGCYRELLLKLADGADAGIEPAAIPIR